MGQPCCRHLAQASPFLLPQRRAPWPREGGSASLESCVSRRVSGVPLLARWYARRFRLRLLRQHPLDMLAGLKKFYFLYMVLHGIFFRRLRRPPEDAPLPPHVSVIGFAFFACPTPAPSSSSSSCSSTAAPKSSTSCSTCSTSTEGKGQAQRHSCLVRHSCCVVP